MDPEFKKVLVTGGAGFIGSHLVDHLMRKGYSVSVLDNLSHGSLNNLNHWTDDTRLKFYYGDLKEPCNCEKAVEGVDLVFHFAACPEVRVGEKDPIVHFKENLVVTFNLLEIIRKSGSAGTIVFASTSTIYGEARILPTLEDYGPLIPISTYGASKLGCEALVSAYAYTFDLSCLILRFANVVGPRERIGVVPDFIRKLKENPSYLEILGDGSQKKSYLYVDDCISAILFTLKNFMDREKRVEIYNVGSLDQIDIARIADIVVEEMGLLNVEFVFTGGVDGGRGWRGDVKKMHLSIDNLVKLGWKPKHTSEEAVKLAVQTLLDV